MHRYPLTGTMRHSEAFQIATQIQKEIDAISLSDVASLHTISTDEFFQRIDHLIFASAPNPNLAYRLKQEFLGWGPIENLLSDSAITEIIICAPDKIAVERNGQLFQHNDHFLTKATYALFIRRLCHEAGIELSYITPFLNGRWRDFRIHMTSEPITENTVVHLRRTHITQWSLQEQENKGMITKDQSLIIQELIQKQKSILVVGNTGSGKTTLVNSLLTEVPTNQRVLIIEDTNELIVPNLVSNKMLTRFDPQQKLPNIDQALLIQQALRMRPDRLIVGEVRGPEAKDLILALSTGHRGALGTLHAEDARQALLRLEMLVSLGAPQWPITTIRQMIRLGLDHLIVTRRHENGRRCVEGIYRISSLEEFGLITDQIA